MNGLMAKMGQEVYGDEELGWIGRQAEGISVVLMVSCGLRLVWAHGYIMTPCRQGIGRQKWVKNGYASGYGTGDVGIWVKVGL